ncbi:MAG: hypothetical protein ACI856_002278, partial [Kiritimatiellia bacterium]
WRRLACTVLIGSSLVTASLSFPDYISYFPAWSGGTHNGYRHLADSNFDWGQDVERLEVEWAALTKVNGGQPPHLIYFGFLDPEHMYGMPVTKPSMKGFMDHRARLRHGQQGVDAWLERVSGITGTTVFSLSAMQLEPFGIDVQGMRNAEERVRVGKTLRVAVLKQDD